MWQAPTEGKTWFAGDRLVSCGAGGSEIDIIIGRRTGSGEVKGGNGRTCVAARGGFLVEWDFQVPNFPIVSTGQPVYDYSGKKIRTGRFFARPLPAVPVDIGDYRSSNAVQWNYAFDATGTVRYAWSERFQTTTKVHKMTGRGKLKAPGLDGISADGNVVLTRKSSGSVQQLMMGDGKVLALFSSEDKVSVSEGYLSANRGLGSERLWIPA